MMDTYFLEGSLLLSQYYYSYSLSWHWFKTVCSTLLTVHLSVIMCPPPPLFFLRCAPLNRCYPSKFNASATANAPSDRITPTSHYRRRGRSGETAACNRLQGRDEVSGRGRSPSLSPKHGSNKTPVTAEHSGAGSHFIYLFIYFK